MKYLLTLLVLIFVACGDGGQSEEEDTLTLCKIDRMVLRAELCTMGRAEYCEEE